MTRQTFIRVHLIYKADGMTRPLSFRQVVPSTSVEVAVRYATGIISSAYESGFEVLTWTAENATGTLGKYAKDFNTEGAQTDEASQQGISSRAQ